MSRATLGPAAAPVAVLPFGEVHRSELEFLEQLLAVTFDARMLLLPSVQLPARSWTPSRQQHDADVLLDELQTVLPDRCLRLLGVTEADLFVAGRTFVFGYAHLTDGVAIFSLARLREAFYGRAPDLGRLRTRACRAVLHELGHTFGNGHCEGRCVMHSVTQVETLDALVPRYCAPCHTRLAAGLSLAPWSALGRWQRGMAHLRRRAYERAQEALEHAVRCAPFHARYHEDLGTARLLGGDREGARASFRRAAELGAEIATRTARCEASGAAVDDERTDGSV